jgi:hypothetical protein
LDHGISSTVSNFTFDEMVMADNLAEDEIYHQNLRYSGSRPRPAAASGVADDIVIVVIAVLIFLEQFEFGNHRG